MVFGYFYKTLNAKHPVILRVSVLIKSAFPAADSMFQEWWEWLTSNQSVIWKFTVERDPKSDRTAQICGIRPLISASLYEIWTSNGKAIRDIPVIRVRSSGDDYLSWRGKEIFYDNCLPACDTPNANGNSLDLHSTFHDLRITLVKIDKT